MIHQELKLLAVNSVTHIINESTILSAMQHWLLLVVPVFNENLTTILFKVMITGG